MKCQRNVEKNHTSDLRAGEMSCTEATNRHRFMVGGAALGCVWHSWSNSWVETDVAWGHCPEGSGPCCSWDFRGPILQDSSTEGLALT